jgi:tRNA (guanine37-N1)-methyltransferase
VGPFAVPAAKKGCIVYANDLNPESFKWLNHNAGLNKLKTLKTFNLDGRDFIRHAVTLHRQEFPQQPWFNHFVMNLPALAIEFLDAFKGLYAGLDVPDAMLPWIHCHCFSKSKTPEQDVIEVKSHGNVRLTQCSAQNRLLEV